MGRPALPTAGQRTAPATVVRVRHDRGESVADQVDDVLIVEEPMSIQLDGHLVTTTMRTPGHDFELAAGFCFTDGLLAGAPVTNVRYVPRHDSGESLPVGVDSEANVVTVDTNGRAPVPRPRLGNVSSSCGWCGSEQIDDLCLRLGPLAQTPPIDLEVLAEVSATVRANQELFGLTGAVHAAAVFDREGRIVVAREDVGRHNAVDKVIGCDAPRRSVAALRPWSVHQRPCEHRDGPEGVGGRCHDPACRERPDGARRRIGPSSGHDVGRLHPSRRLQRLLVALLVIRGAPGSAALAARGHPLHQSSLPHGAIRHGLACHATSAPRRGHPPGRRAPGLPRSSRRRRRRTRPGLASDLNTGRVLATRLVLSVSPLRPRLLRTCRERSAVGRHRRRASRRWTRLRPSGRRRGRRRSGWCR